MADTKSHSADWETLKSPEISSEGHGKWTSGGLKDVVLDILSGGERVGSVLELGQLGKMVLAS